MIAIPDSSTAVQLLLLILVVSAVEANYLTTANEVSYDFELCKGFTPKVMSPEKVYVTPEYPVVGDPVMLFFKFKANVNFYVPYFDVRASYDGVPLVHTRVKVEMEFNAGEDYTFNTKPLKVIVLPWEVQREYAHDRSERPGDSVLHWMGYPSQEGVN